MEGLLDALGKSCVISQVNEISKSRKNLYKTGGCSIDIVREKRRTELLEDYKRKREALLNEKRGLLDDDFNDDADWMDWQEPKNHRNRKWMNYNCKNQLMMSEWLLDRPSNLETDWTCVLCPEGRRTLVVSKRGCTRAYYKSGMLLAKFKSILPNGAPSSNRSKRSDIVILDCIWREATKQLYALDVLHWKNQTLLDCDAQFRLYWLKSKLSEVRQSLIQEPPENGVCDVHLPPHCSVSKLSETLAENDPSQVDGILFYHNSAPYISGQTPLVGWLKPFMLPERFGIEVPVEYMSLRPDSYTNLEHWVTLVSHDHRRNPSSAKRQEMDTSEAEVSDNSVVSACEIEDIKETQKKIF